MLNNDENAINEIEVIEPIVVVKQECEPGKTCVAKEYFEMITECALCGKIC